MASLPELKQNRFEQAVYQYITKEWKSSLTQKGVDDLIAKIKELNLKVEGTPPITESEIRREAVLLKGRLTSDKVSPEEIKGWTDYFGMRLIAPEGEAKSTILLTGGPFEISKADEQLLQAHNNYFKSKAAFAGQKETALDVPEEDLKIFLQALVDPTTITDDTFGIVLGLADHFDSPFLLEKCFEFAKKTYFSTPSDIKENFPFIKETLENHPHHLIQAFFKEQINSYIESFNYLSGFNAFAKDFPKLLPHVTRLTLPLDTFKDWPGILSLFPNLTSLDFSRTSTYTDDDWLKAIQNLPLTSLNLEGCFEITNEGLESLSKMPIIYLNLTGCWNINNLQSLQNTLSSLNLSTTYISDSELEPLSKLPLVFLNLANGQITDNGLKSLPKSLTFLGLSGCRNITDNGFLYFIQQLTTTQLEINVERNFFSDNCLQTAKTMRPDIRLIY